MTQPTVNPNAEIPIIHQGKIPMTNDPVTKAMRTKFNRKIYGALRTEGNNKKISLTEGQMNQIGILIEPIIKKALTSLAQEKDKHYKEAMDLLEDDFKAKCADIEQLKADEIKWLVNEIMLKNQMRKDNDIFRMGADEQNDYHIGRLENRLAQLRGKQ